MLNVMRKHAGSWMIKVILFAIVIVFVFWGVGSFRSREASKVATVNDEMIGLADYRRAYNNLLDQYRKRFGSSLNDGMIEMLQIKRQALNQLIDRTILLQEVKKLDLRVSKSEIADSIMNTEVFQNNGFFDNRRYRSVLAQVHITPEEFEAEQKNVLLSQKLTRIVMGAAKVSEVEARQWYDWKNTSVNLDYVCFKPERYKDVEPSEEEISAFFEKKGENYRTDPTVKVRYVVFDSKTYESAVKLNEDDIVDYYDSNQSDFKVEKTVEASHILFRVDPNADDKADQAAKAKAEEVANLAKSNQDFSKLAKEYSEGPTKDTGGYLGKFQHSQMVKPFADKAFSMAKGEISDPVKTQFGWHVIKVDSVEEASTKSIEESREQIADLLKERDAKNLAYDRVELFYESIFEKEDFVSNAKTADLTVMETELFDRKGPKSLGEERNDFAKIAFALKVDEVSDIQEIGSRYFLIQPMEKVDAAIPQLADVKTKVRTDLVKSIQANKAKADAEAMAGDLKSGKSFEESSNDYKVDIINTGLFKRHSPIPEIGSDSKVSDAAFVLSSAGSTNEMPVQGTAGFYLLWLVEKMTPEADGFEAEKENINAMLLQQKQRTSMQDWIEARKAESKITIEKEYLE